MILMRCAALGSSFVCHIQYLGHCCIKINVERYFIPGFIYFCRVVNTNLLMHVKYETVLNLSS